MKEFQEETERLQDLQAFEGDASQKGARAIQRCGERVCLTYSRDKEGTKASGM